MPSKEEIDQRTEQLTEVMWRDVDKSRQLNKAPVAISYLVREVAKLQLQVEHLLDDNSILMEVVTELSEKKVEDAVRRTGSSVLPLLHKDGPSESEGQSGVQERDPQVSQ
jgi:hypothetical protein